jgi:16S rRNA (adenine1518-N6/adenine1519-N6)-dimethyltransferase
MGAGIDLPPLNLPDLLRRHGITPHKGLGQNFLSDDQLLRRIVESAEITSAESVLEIGAGLGSLTRWLVQVAAQVVAVEVDINLIPILTQVLADWKQVRVVSGDILQLDPAALMGKDGYVVVANIPYYITSALFRHLLEARLKPSRMVLTVQREVAQRICARAGELNLLALSVQVYGQPRSLFCIPAGAFYPPPKVDSEVLRVDLYPQPLIPADHLDDFFHLIKAGFGQKRKMLHNALFAGLGCPKERLAELLDRVGIDPQRRAQTLTLDEWRLLTEAYRSLN